MLMLIQEPKETHESINQSHEPGSSSTSSNSSGTKPTHLFEMPPNLLQSRIATSKKMSPKTQGHTNAPKNIKNLPPLPTSRTGSTMYNVNNDMYRLNRVHRSASTREFRNSIKGSSQKYYMQWITRPRRAVTLFFFLSFSENFGSYLLYLECDYSYYFSFWSEMLKIHSFCILHYVL